MYPPDKTIPTNDNFFLRLNIHAVIVSRHREIRPPHSPFSRHSRKSFASVYVYKHTARCETMVSIIRSINEHQLWNSRSRGRFSRRSEIFVSRPKEKLSRFNPENGAKSWTKKKKKKIRLDEEGRLCTAWTDYNRILIELKFNYNALQSSHVHLRVDGLKRACN